MSLEGLRPFKLSLDVSYFSKFYPLEVNCGSSWLVFKLNGGAVFLLLRFLAKRSQKFGVGL